jgi:hypothetical protein
MKTTTVLAIALGIGALAACKQSPQEQTADNVQANADNTADAVRNQGEQKADEVRNSAHYELSFDPLARRRVGQRASQSGRPFRLWLEA